MTNTYTEVFPIQNVESLPLNKHTEEMGFIINGYKASIKDEFIFDSSNEKDKHKKNREFEKKLFQNLRLDNSYYTKTQKWLGHVVEITENGFNAILKDLSNGGTEEYGEFFNEEIAPDDLCLVSNGATFYMSLGFISNNGSRKRESEIRFQRLAEFNEDDINNKGLDLSSDFINYFK